MRSLQQVDPLLLHVANPPSTVALHAEADVGPTSGKREAPHVPGQQVGLEPHDQSLGRRPRDVAGVLAERVPLAEVAGLANSEGLAGGGPHPIGGDDIPRRRCVPTPSTSISTDSGPGRMSAERVALVNRRTRIDRQVDERGVELAPRRGRGEDPVGGQGHAHFATRRRSQPRGIDRLPTRHHRRSQSQLLELAERQRGETVAAALVAREHRLVDDDDRSTGAGQQRCGGRTGRTRADDDDVGGRGQTHRGQAKGRRRQVAAPASAAASTPHVGRPPQPGSRAAGDTTRRRGTT